MPAPNPLRDLVERAVAEGIDSVVTKAVGTAIPRSGEAGRFKVALVGAFSRRGVANLITVAANPEFEGALVFVDGDVVRTLYARGGALIGADSNVLFERLGRVLEKSGRIDRDTRRALVASEESEGTAAAAALVPADVAKAGLERRVREVAETLFLVKRGQFIAVEGTPSIAPVPEVSLSPDEVAREGIARYETWRSGGAASAAVPFAPPVPAPPPAPVASSPPAPPAPAPVAPAPASVALPPARPSQPPSPPSPDETQDVVLESFDLELPPAPPRGSTTTTADLEPVRFDDDDGKPAR